MKQMVCWLTASLLVLGNLPARAGEAVAAADETPATPEAPARPATSGFWQRSWDNVETTWRSDRYELYLPAITWHNRAFYDRDKIDEYNEHPWGLGLGRYRYDSDGNWHALYAMFFLDSHDKVEPFAGYAWQKIWRPADDVRLGAGFTVGVTARSDYSYIPFPAILPLVSVEYRRLALQATYIPGGHNNGNVLFGWLRWQL
ncbi:lipid IV(A) palmitoyltransferase PagP [Laribacter hongkongensis]|jgi:palmitoyl transferase|uniref:Lipid A acyltransferase PagP n=1 Tax=Laribacter hongkongensis TaxID=168471 RepID=A0ABD4SMS6_9NEIS|nr:lipid IV(A) palmitoyltransferase PagP [Laribacter hongkongensis]MCG9025026.1 lipid IV(A) palmitoyltransferase PagP [Laribacter hongkongensis]MCG9083286.1 lipid IV(A) palmitoyltransferase PagP [Laribacter hongkongensis]MCG9100527.1 lipid IV(A) palmitoyltransferase PagP [Laribacter hongkongensis]MCG9104727.1 lipid IV(A) palmitoyltransferase PagP [Laribacter hongkongensis]MCG9111709.1 lipid IV(A) palmitoyltransferase PagP [Laribacter hongkongensis]